MKNFLIHCSGANKELLSLCPTEENKYVGLGGTVLVTAGMAGAAGYVFGTMALRLPAPAAVFVGLGAFAATFNLDRWLLSSHSRQETLGKEVLAALPRIGMSLLIGAVISEPLVLTVYAPEINNQLARNQADARRKAQERIEQNPRYQQIRGLLESNAGLRQQIVERRAQRDAFYASYLEEAEGTSGSGIVGKGPVFKEKGERLARAEKELADAQQGAQAEVAANQKRLEDLQQQKEQELRTLDQFEGLSGGMLARERALEQLTADNPGLLLKRCIFALFLMMIDCLPVLSKLMQAMSRRHPYQSVVEGEEERVIAQVTQDMRVHAADTQAQADSEIAIRQHQYQLLTQLEIDNAQLAMQKIADARLALVEEQIAEWEARERQRLQNDLDLII